MALCDTQDIKKDAKLIDLHQRVCTMLDNEEATFQRKSKVGNWLKMVISLFPLVIPDGYVVVNRKNGHVLVNNKNPISVNEWLPNYLRFFKYDATFSPESLLEIENLLKTKRKEERKAQLRRHKECRNKKLTNDIISMNEMILEIKKNIANSKND